MASRLPNYLKTYRRRSGLSQEELAYLLGTRSKAQVCRYERFGNRAPLETAVACALVFGVPLEELFAGTLEEIERRTRCRARRMTRKLEKQEADPLSAQKRRTLEAIASAEGRNAGAGL